MSVYLDSPLAERLGWTLLLSIGQIFVIAAGMALALWATRKNSAGLRHGIGLAAIVAMAACPGATFLQQSRDDWAPMVRANALPSHPANTDLNADGIAGPRLSPWLLGPPATAEGHPGRQEPAPPPKAVVTLSRQQLHTLAFLWTCGSLTVLLWRVGGWLKLRRWRRGAKPVIDPKLCDLGTRMNVRRPTKLYLSRCAPAPMLLGGLRPMILVPARLTSILTPRQLEAVLAHELAHVRRWDDWAVLVQSMVETFLFFHPAVWWAGTVLEREREFAADDLAAAALSDRSGYALALARLAQLCAHHAAPPLGATSGGPMITRLRRIMTIPPTPTRRGTIPMLAFAGLASVAVIPLPPDLLKQHCRLVATNQTPDSQYAAQPSAQPRPGPSTPEAERLEVEDGNHATPTPFYPTAEEGEAATTVVKNFLLADNEEDRLRFVRFPDKVRPLMKRWYEAHPTNPVVATRDDLAETLSKFVHVDGQRFIVVTVLTKPDQEYKIFALEVASDGSYKLDWETAVGWQPMPLQTFLNTRPTTPQNFRVQAGPGDYYNGAFSDLTKWCALDISYPGNPAFRLFGYVERDTAAGKRLMRLLGIEEVIDPSGTTVRDAGLARSAPLILTLAFPPESNSGTQVVVQDVLHEHWFLPDGPASTP
jgi:beta-lactamase regulating signal transducer with metallopeptidase domain